MTVDPWWHEAIKLLSRGHNLYGSGYLDAGRSNVSEQLRQHADRLFSWSGPGMGATGPVNAAMAADLHRSAAGERELAAVLADGRAEYELGRRGTRGVLNDARSDSMPAADTPLGRRQAWQRMAARLRHQQHYLRRSRQYSHLLARRLNPLRAAALQLRAVRYEKVSAPTNVRQRIAVALDHLGITDPAARRNWMRGYLTLIARESGGQPWAVASQPATALGGMQPDGHSLGFARGITQTTPATFARFHQPGTSTNIYDPVANICASMNYVVHRYGVHRDGGNLAALVQQADAHRPPKGY